jgi:hypothetical protein
VLGSISHWFYARNKGICPPLPRSEVPPVLSSLFLCAYGGGCCLRVDSPCSRQLSVVAAARRGTRVPRFLSRLRAEALTELLGASATGPKVCALFFLLPSPHFPAQARIGHRQSVSAHSRLDQTKPLRQA